MMNADKGVIYKGLPQDDWEKKPKIAKILSTGPPLLSNPSGNTKKKSYTKRFLTVVFFLSIFTVLGVISFRIYGTHSNGFYDFWGGPATDKPNDLNNTSSTSSNGTVVNQDTALQNSSSSNETTGYEGLEENEPITSAQTPSLANLPLTNQTTTHLAHPSLDYSETSSGFGRTLTSTDVESEPSTTEFTPEFSEITTQPSASWPSQIGTPAGGTSVSPATMNQTSNLTASVDRQNDSSLNNGSSLFSEILHEYFNSSSPKEEQIRQWLEHLLSKPSLEVTIIAAGIIFAGVSLLVIGVVCAIGRGNRRKIRHRLNRKAREGNRIEKVILLADDASEDEFTKT